MFTKGCSLRAPAFLLLACLTGASFSSASELELSTYLAGQRQDRPAAVAIGPSGEIVVAGTTYSADFPLVEALKETKSTFQEIFVSKFSGVDGELVFSTYLGGDGDDFVSDLAVDSAGNIYLTGGTWSSDFPLVNAFQTERTFAEDNERALDAFLIKLSPGGDEILFSSFLGGGRQDTGWAVVANDSGLAYVAGGTASLDFLQVGSLQEERGGSAASVAPDIFVTAIDTVTGTVLFSTFWGGRGSDEAMDMAQAPDGSLWIGGSAGAGFPTVAPPLDVELNENVSAAFLMRLDPDEPRVLLSVRPLVFFDSFAIDRKGNAFLLGDPGPPVGNGLDIIQNDCPERTVLIRIAGSDSDLTWECLGAPAGPMAFDGRGRLVLAGIGGADERPRRAVQDALAGKGDVFVSLLRKNRARARFASFLGGSENETVTDIAVRKGVIAVVGTTRSSDFPLVRPSQTEKPGGKTKGAFVAAIRP